MVFIPPPPKELQKENLEKGEVQQQNQNHDLVRPIQDEDIPSKKAKKEKMQKEKKNKPEKQERIKKEKDKGERKLKNGIRGKIVLCVMGLLASLALIGFVVYLLAF